MDAPRDNQASRTLAEAAFLFLAVEPGATYTYSVTALDSAPYGLYPQGDRMDTRVGNESAPAGPVTLFSPEWNSAHLLSPIDSFQYLGGFRLPPNRDEFWSYTSGGLAFYPTGNPGYDPTMEWPGSLFLYTHSQREIAEITIPIPVRSVAIDDLPYVRGLKEPINLWPRIYPGDDPTVPPGGTDIKVAGLAFHPGVGAVSELLYYGVCNYFATDGDSPSHGWFNLSLTESGGAWHVGGPPPANIYPGLITKIAFAAPSSWADAYTGGRSLIVGDTFLSGGNVIAHGPSLFAIAPWESGSLPPPGGSVSAVNLLRYSEGADIENRVINFTRAEFSEGGAWLQAGDQSAVAISYQRSVGDTWYGDSFGNINANWDIPEPPMGDKGVSATRWKTGLMLYNPDDLAAVALGNRPSWEPQPYAVVDFSRYSMREDGGNGIAGAIAYDAENRRLFFIEHNGDPGYEWGYSMIHVWAIQESQPSTQCSSWLVH